MADNTTKTVIVPQNNVEGNITSCEVKDMVINAEKTSVFQLTIKETHMVYDVCTRKEVNRYDQTHLADFGWAMIIAPIFLVFFIIVASSDSHY
ncbi:MAG: hypothetical protein WA019_03520 [Candidatus Moraniibacteriota bacterium]